MVLSFSKPGFMNLSMQNDGACGEGLVIGDARPLQNCIGVPAEGYQNERLFPELEQND